MLLMKRKKMEKLINHAIKKQICLNNYRRRYYNRNKLVIHVALKAKMHYIKM